MKNPDDEKLNRLVHGLLAKETLLDSGRVVVHDGTYCLGDFDIAQCFMKNGPTFKSLSNYIRFAPIKEIEEMEKQ